MRLVVFDHRGRAWDPRAPRLAQHLGSSISGEVLADYTVRNMGYVAVAAFERSMHVRLRPAIAAPGALGALLVWLQERPVERILLSTFEDGWSHALMPSHQAVRRVTVDYLHQAA
jgi:hypothetical protein